MAFVATHIRGQAFTFNYGYFKQSSMSALTRLILFFSLVHIKGQRPHGEKCVYDGDCKSGLLCAFEDKLFNPHRICQCPPELVYVDGHCEKAKNEVEIAEILAIIIPVISSVIVTILVILGRVVPIILFSVISKKIRSQTT